MLFNLRWTALALTAVGLCQILADSRILLQPCPLGDRYLRPEFPGLETVFLTSNLLTGAKATGIAKMRAGLPECTTANRPHYRSPGGQMST